MIPSTTSLNAKSLAARMKQAAEQGDGDALVALAHEMSVNATQPGMADTAHRLMGLTQKVAVHRTREVAQILVRAGTPASRPYMVMAAALEETAVLERRCDLRQVQPGTTHVQKERVDSGFIKPLSNVT